MRVSRHHCRDCRLDICSTCYEDDHDTHNVVLIKTLIGEREKSMISLAAIEVRNRRAAMNTNVTD